jgi:hypothetical protein
VNSECRAQRQEDFPAHNVVSRQRIKTSGCVDVVGWKKRGIFVEHVVYPGADLHMLGYVPVGCQIKVAVVRDMRQHRIKETCLLIPQRDLDGPQIFASVMLTLGFAGVAFCNLSPRPASAPRADDEPGLSRGR